MYQYARIKNSFRDPEDRPDWLKEGAFYPVEPVGGCVYRLRRPDGNHVLISKTGCAWLDGGEWELLTEDEYLDLHTVSGKAEDKQIGGSHYKAWTIQPYLLMLTLTGPGAHIAGYLLREKGADDLDKAEHWCDLALEAGMQFVKVELMVPPEVEDDYDSQPAAISVMEWCWRNGITPESALAQALQSLEEGDYRNVKKCINLLREERGIAF